MKVLLGLHHCLDPNLGAPGATLMLGEALTSLGCTVEYFAFDQAYTDRSTSAISMAVQFPWRVNAFLNKFAGDFDVLDISTGDNWVWAMRGRKNAKARHALVTRSHGLEHVANANLIRDVKSGHRKVSWKYPVYHGGFRLWEVAQSLRLADRTILLNSYDREYAVKELGVSGHKFSILPAGMHASLIGLGRPNIPSLLPENVGLVFIGSYIERKGIKYLDEAVRFILRNYPSSRFSYLGTCCDPEVILSKFDSNIRERVSVVSRFEKKNLPGLLAGNHIHLFPSLSEGFPVAVLESMACGLIPVVSNIPGPTEFCESEKNAIIVPPRDSQAIVQAVDRLIATPALAESIRQSAYETAQSFGWESIAARSLAIYEEVLRNKQI